MEGAQQRPPRQPKNHFDLKRATMGKKNSFKKTWWRRFIPSNKGGQHGQHIGQDENGQKQENRTPHNDPIITTVVAWNEFDQKTTEQSQGKEDESYELQTDTSLKASSHAASLKQDHIVIDVYSMKSSPKVESITSKNSPDLCRADKVLEEIKQLAFQAQQTSNLPTTHPEQVQKWIAKRRNL